VADGLQGQRRVSRPRTESGFTLVEVLVALVIFAMISSAGVALLSFSVNNRTSVKAVSDRGAALQRTRQLLRADLGQAAPRGVRTRAGQAELAFVGGDGGRLISLTRAGWSNADGRPRPSLQRVDYRLVDKRLERVVHQQLDGGASVAPQILYDGVSNATVTFLSGGFESRTWPVNDQRQMPDAVRLDMTFEGYGPLTQWFLVGGGAQ